MRKEVKNKRKQAPTSTSVFLLQLIDENGNAHSIHGLSQHKIRYHDTTQDLRISESPKSFPVMPSLFKMASSTTTPNLCTGFQVLPSTMTKTT
jgi:hypothetical protein